MGKIPKRWKDYSAHGKPIKDIPVFAFKTPLKNQCTPESIVNSMTELGHEVVAVIDLTNTLKYYNGIEEFKEKFNVEYEKIQCEGQKIPNNSVFERVSLIISDVIRNHGRDSKKLVGIHCTHGINRTGYLVARYMIEWLGYEPQSAIKAFNNARGHGIERKVYIKDLKERIPDMRFEKWKNEQL